MSNEEIAEAYRQRWAIEVLWKFLKTHLQLDKMMSKNLNEITMQIYTILIVYLLLQLYAYSTATPIEIPRINQRTQKMLAAGLVQETERLQAKYGADLPLLKTLGYQEISNYLAGHSTLATAQALIVKHTCQLAKRQRTWFRAQTGLVTIDCDRPDLISYSWAKVQAFLTAIRY